MFLIFCYKSKINYSFRDLFYPAFKTKVDDFFEMMNIDKDSDNSFFRRFTVQITSKQLDAPFPEIENDIEIH